MSKMPWLYCPTLVEHDQIELPPAELRHLVGSHRRRAGESLVLFDGAGAIAVAEVRELVRRPLRGWVEIVSREIYPMPGRRIHLASALPKGERQGLLLDLATQFGITDFTPLDCVRSVARSGAVGYQRWQRILIESCKQCHRPWLPSLHANCPPNTFLSRNISSYGAVLLADANGQPSREVDLDIIGAASLLLIVGPEGGFTVAERDSLLESGALPICLAATNLRIEAAAVALVAMAVR